LTVEFYGLGAEAEPIKLGDVIFDGAEITATDEKLLKVKDETLVLAGGGTIHATTDPEGFMRNLWRHFKSPYFLARKPTEG